MGTWRTKETTALSDHVVEKPFFTGRRTCFMFRIAPCEGHWYNRAEGHVAGLFRTDDTSDHLVVEVRRTRKTTALSDYIVEQQPFFIGGRVCSVLRTGIQTHVLAGVVNVMCCGQVSLVLGRPARGTGEGGGHHDGGGLRGPTHGAGHVVVVMTANMFILTTVEVAVYARHKRCVIELWLPGQTQTVGAASFLGVLFPSGNPCITAHRRRVTF